MEKMGSKGSNHSPGKPMKRKSHTRKIPQHWPINMAEARRDVVNALLVHRASSSSSSSSSCVSSWGSAIRGNNSTYGINKPVNVASSQQYYCSIMESLPLPEPIWSTTAPSIHATPSPMEALEFEWGESLNSSYTWWLGFLETMDGKNTTQESKCPFEDKVLMGNPKVLGECMDGSMVKEGPSMDAYDHSPYPDEWLTIPTTEDQGEIINSKDSGGL